MNLPSDFHQWPLVVKVTIPVWLPLFLVGAVVFYIGGFIWGMGHLARERFRAPK